MDQDIHIEAILHLSALALIITIAYLGLDRVHLEKDVFLEALEGARVRSADFIRRYDIQPGAKPDPTSMFYRFPFWVKLKFYALCQIAGVNWDIDMGWHWRCLHWCHRQRHVPLLGYFKKRRDRDLVSVFAALFLAIFLYMTAAALWSWHSLPTDIIPGVPPVPMKTVAIVTYWLSVIMLLWIFFTVGITHILQHIGPICVRLENAIDEHMKAITADVTRSTLQTAQNSAAPGAAA